MCVRDGGVFGATNSGLIMQIHLCILLVHAGRRERALICFSKRHPVRLPRWEDIYLCKLFYLILITTQEEKDLCLVTVKANNQRMKCKELPFVDTEEKSAPFFGRLALTFTDITYQKQSICACRGGERCSFIHNF